MIKGLNENNLKIEWGKYNPKLSDHIGVKVVIENMEKSEHQENAI